MDPPSATLAVEIDRAIEGQIQEMAPSIRRRLQQRGVTGEDLEDLCADSIQRIFRALQYRGEAIRNPGGYSIAVADTVFSDHLRRIKPNWCRLKRQVIYLLDEERSAGHFARWRVRHDWLGGFSSWRGRHFQATAQYSAFCTDHRTFCRAALQQREPSDVPLPELMERLFQEIETPVEVDRLTGHLADIRQVRDREALSLEGLESEGGLQDRLRIGATEWEAGAAESFAAKPLRDSLWQQIYAIPLRQRMALLLAMTQDEMLLVGGRLTDVAEALETPPTELGRIWGQLPLKDRAIADRLGVTAKQVSNLRKCARERIARWMEARTGS